MSLIVDSIFTEWRASLPEGSSHPNTKNGYHLFLLKEICLKRGISENIINSVILALEADDKEPPLDDKEKERAKEMGLVWKGKGYGKETDDFISFKNVDGKLKPVEPEKKGKEKETGTEISPTFDPKTYDAKTGTSPVTTDSDNEEEVQAKQVKQNAERNKASWDKIKKLEGPAKEAAKNEHLSNQLDNMLAASTRGEGAGRYNMSSTDIRTYRTYVQKMMADPDNQPKKMIDDIKARRERQYGKIEEEDIDKFIKDLLKRGDSKLKTVIKKKGTPGASYYKGEKGDVRFRNVIKAYLETGGVSPITKEVVPFSECQLDHITSLGNQGEDGPENWMFMEERFNQFKRKKTDEGVRADLEGEYWKTEAEIAAGVQSKETDTFIKEEGRNFWRDKFQSVKESDSPREIGLSYKELEKMNKKQLNNFVVGWNRANMITNSEGKQIIDPNAKLSRYSETKVMHNGVELVYSRSEGGNSPIKPIEGDESTYGLELVGGKDGTVQQNHPKDYETSLARFQSNRPSGGTEKNVDQYIAMIKEEGLATDMTDVDETFEQSLRDLRTGQKQRDKERDAIVKKAKNAPGSYDKKNKEVKATMKIWDLDNQEPYGKSGQNGKYIKSSSTRQKEPAWQKWKKKRDIYLYQQWKKYDSTNRLQP